MSAGNLLKMLGGMGPGGPGAGAPQPGGLLGQLGGGSGAPAPAGPTPDQGDMGGAQGTCQDCVYWHTPNMAGIGGGMGVCAMLSDMADQPPDETSITPTGATFKCGPDWYCKYFAPMAGGEGPTPDQGLPGGAASGGGNLLPQP